MFFKSSALFLVWKFSKTHLLVTDQGCRPASPFSKSILLCVQKVVLQKMLTKKSCLESNICFFLFSQLFPWLPSQWPLLRALAQVCQFELENDLVLFTFALEHIFPKPPKNTWNSNSSDHMAVSNVNTYPCIHTSYWWMMVLEEH